MIIYARGKSTGFYGHLRSLGEELAEGKLLYRQSEVRKFNYFVLDCRSALSAERGSS
jgi:hypothetical protein